MAQSSIEWTEQTWNPTTGCKKCPMVVNFAMPKWWQNVSKQWVLKNT